ncbi:hypothetical protein MVEG_11379 [Podila verticillata NRRL 6337]|uniref:Uncharacterized protein n=1 Tax=Podila verticillata NRRL 6337 TaxID=1069443 RepID=A0A086TLM7_9FUNG|nr:hypothetical protein MVEG_11379 [Podila verticillata NRRL 6337]
MLTLSLSYHDTLSRASTVSIAISSVPLRNQGVRRLYTVLNSITARTTTARTAGMLPTLTSSSTPTTPTTPSAPNTLQPDLSSSSFGASFGAQSPPSSMKRPLADMADSQDRNWNIDDCHQVHQQHQASQPSHPEPTLPLTGIKLQLQIMPPDHPPVDSTGVCPIVYGSQQRERLQQIQQVQAQRPTGRKFEMREQVSKDSSRGPCRWSKPTYQWKNCNDHDPVGHDCYSPSNSLVNRHEQGDGHSNTNKG